jgi:hypothetical protein
MKCRPQVESVGLRVERAPTQAESSLGELTAEGTDKSTFAKAELIRLFIFIDL